MSIRDWGSKLSLANMCDSRNKQAETDRIGTRSVTRQRLREGLSQPFPDVVRFSFMETIHHNALFLNTSQCSLQILLVDSMQRNCVCVECSRCRLTTFCASRHSSGYDLGGVFTAREFAGCSKCFEKSFG